MTLEEQIPAVAPSLVLRGLSEDDAARRLRKDGPNEIAPPGGRNFGRILRDVLSEPMFALLLAAAGVYFLLGDAAEAAALGAFATLSVSIAFVQEWRSERVLKTLRELASPRALVVRDGKLKRIAGRDVVRGDLILLSEGDRVPADAWISAGAEILADESLLTGESAPVRKRAAPDEAPRALTPGGDDLPTVFAGTLIAGGAGEAVVTATGALSAVGRIGGALATIAPEAPRLRRETMKIIRVFAIVGLATSLVAGALYGIAQESFLAGLLSSIAVAMSMLPEEFPLVLAVFLAMGAHRIASARVLTRRAAAIETLGAVTVLCTDKTGTLTVNRMEVAAATTASASWRRDRRGPAAESVRRLAEVAVLAGLPEPIDPMEQALKRFLAAHGASPPTAKRELVLRKGPAAGVLAVRQVWRWPDGRMFLAAKGAPETIVALCALAGADRERVLDEARRLAAEGLRVLGVACAEGRADPGALTEARLGYLGLVGFEDPVRESAPAAVAEFRRAGVRVVMITGDLPETARAIAAQAGLDSGRVLVGAEIGRLDDRALREAVKSCDVFARILPADKLRIVEALKANGEVVGMTGDGVNDAPSLAAAHIGVAMGGRGSDVAREASSIVLLDDDFGALAETVRLGRRIYDNLRKAMGYILSVHVPIAGMALLPPLAGGPLILTPALIAILELIIDPACSIVFEAEPAEKNVMDRPPRDPRASLLDRRLIGLGAAEGLVAFFVVAVVYASVAGRADEEIRTVVFGALALVNVGLIFAHRSFAPTARAAFAAFNPRLGLGLVVVAAAFLAIFGLPDARALFELAPLSAGDLLLCAGAALAFMTASFSLKRLFRRRA